MNKNWAKCLWPFHPQGFKVLPRSASNFFMTSDGQHSRGWQFLKDSSQIIIVQNKLHLLILYLSEVIEECDFSP